MVAPFTRVSSFVPDSLDAAQWPNLEPLYGALLARPVNSPGDLERLILDRSELDAAATEAGTELYIAMTCNTEDPAIAAAYMAFVENVQPRMKEVGFELDKKIVLSPHAAGLDRERYAVLLRDLRVGVELFRPENVPIETELTKLDQQYQQIFGAMMVSFRGAEYTLPRMARFGEEVDRATREDAWRATAERRLKDAGAIEDLFDEMVSRRQALARNAGFANFRDYMFRVKRRFDYTPDDCHGFAKGIERTIVPALRRFSAQRARNLGISPLRPWDMQVDPLSRPPLRPFETADEMLAKTRRAFARMEPMLSELFESLCGGGCLDLDSRKGKAPGGYQSNRDRQRVPFIFMNAAGVQRDVETMVHEAGHAFHALLSRHDPIFAYRADVPMEIAEVASMSMELTLHPFLDEFYSPADAARARRVHLENIATLLASVAMIDQFQHWIYTHEGHSRAERTQVWLDLNRRFGAGVDWTGLEHILEHAWHRILHLFSVPFYYIEYGIAQLGSLQLFRRYRRDPAEAIRGYVKALSLGASRPLPDLFRAGGLEFDFSPGTIDELWTGVVEKELSTLSN